mmetsp:Transcript_9823/g.25818  ORF Transcript_9823/g.25818 Transcript_9823/m.25818 type:complete len:231 (+) Transcript_9823:385-1077(+)
MMRCRSDFGTARRQNAPVILEPFGVDTAMRGRAGRPPAPPKTAVEQRLQQLSLAFGVPGHSARPSDPCLRDGTILQAASHNVAVVHETGPSNSRCLQTRGQLGWSRTSPCHAKGQPPKVRDEAWSRGHPRTASSLRSGAALGGSLARLEFPPDAACGLRAVALAYQWRSLGGQRRLEAAAPVDMATWTSSQNPPPRAMKRRTRREPLQRAPTPSRSRSAVASRTSQVGIG